jgi:hypothetical protein
VCSSDLLLLAGGLAGLGSLGLGGAAARLLGSEEKALGDFRPGP